MTQPVRERLAPYRDSSTLRRQTFMQGWPHDFISVNELAEDGFYFTGRGDAVQCAYCGGIIKAWARGDTPRGEHRKHFPHCTFLREPFHHPHYRDEQARIQSFRDWPAQLKQRPRQLAKAGLFYLGSGDKTQCFWCGGILKEWEPADDPVLEHIRWFPTCSYMKVMKGEPFIQAVGQTMARPVVEKSPLETVQEMGFSMVQIQSAIENIDECRTLDCDVLLRAILEIEDEQVAGPSSGYRSPQASPQRSPQRSPQPQPPSAPRQAWVMAPSGSSAEVNVPYQEPPESMQTEVEEFGDVRSLTKENYEMKKRSLCKICMEEDISVVFLPCGHLVCCYSCGYVIQDCPICRLPIERCVRVFW